MEGGHGADSVGGAVCDLEAAGEDRVDSVVGADIDGAVASADNDYGGSPAGESDGFQEEGPGVNEGMGEGFPEGPLGSGAEAVEATSEREDKESGEKGEGVGSVGDELEEGARGGEGGEEKKAEDEDDADAYGQDFEDEEEGHG